MQYPKGFFRLCYLKTKDGKIWEFGQHLSHDGKKLNFSKIRVKDKSLIDKTEFILED